MRNDRISLLVTAILGVALLGCGESGGPTSTGTPAADRSVASDAGVSDVGASDVGVTAASSAPVRGDQRIEAPGATFVLPSSWQRVPPSSSMRLAQASIPGPGGAAELTVFHFGAGGGGAVEDNLARWAGQIESNAEPTSQSFTSDGGFQVSLIEAAGTLKPSSMGMGPSHPQPGSRMLAAVVEGEGGPWFFKATGPDSTLAAERDAFVALLRSGAPR